MQPAQHNAALGNMNTWVNQYTALHYHILDQHTPSTNAVTLKWLSNVRAASILHFVREFDRVMPQFAFRNLV